MLTVKIFCFNDFAENTFIIHDSGECVIIDPGCYRQQEKEEIVNYIDSNKLTPKYIVNTHCHIDHVLGVDMLKKHYNIPFYIGEEEKPVLESVKLFAPVYGFSNYSEPETDELLKENQEISFAGITWQILFLPGHSPGHIGLYNAEISKCFSGDVLFHRSIGRTDLPGGDYDTLMKSIRDKLFRLPGHTVIYPGHGPTTTVEEEKLSNPFCGITT